MADLSYQLAFGADQSPLQIAVGTASPTTASNVEMRVDTDATDADGNLLCTTEQVILILEAFIRRLADSKLGSGDVGNI